MKRSRRDERCHESDSQTTLPPLLLRPDHLLSRLVVPTGQKTLSSPLYRDINRHDIVLTLCRC